MTDEHKLNRVNYGNWFLKKFGKNGHRGKWPFLINTDFSSLIRINARHNSKNHVVYGKDKESIKELLVNKEKKFSPGIMLWGGISARGLIPRKAPVYVDDLLNGALKPDGSKKKNVDSLAYIQLLKRKAYPAVTELYPDGNSVWQDDEAKIHRTAAVLETVSELFNSRVPAGMASMTADLLVVENLWSILKDHAAKKGPHKDVDALKKCLNKKWRELSYDLNWCEHMIASMPKRMELVVALNGDQIHKASKAAAAGDS